MSGVRRESFMRLSAAAAIILGTAVVVTGWLRVELDVDVLDVLPPELPEVIALREYRDHFANERELIVALELVPVDPPVAEDESGWGDGSGLAGLAAGPGSDLALPTPLASGAWDDMEEVGEELEPAGRLAQWLARDLQPAPEVRWQDVWESRTEEGADLVAWLLLNLGEPAFAQLRERLLGNAAREVMEGSFEALALTMDPGEIERVRHDPLGLTEPLVEMMADGSLGDFSQDQEGGTSMRLLFVECPDEFQGYKAVARWVEQVRASCERWAEVEGRELGVRWLGLTGEPAFISEVAVGMEYDMRGTAGMTALAIALLFWLFHRRLRPLLWLIAMMILVLGGTLGLGAWLFGSFSVMSVGFASILIGLVVDYGVVIFSEARAEPCTASELRTRVSRSILWAASTTAAVFAVMGFSSLPGVAQLGRLVALGIFLGALVMLLIYLPLAARLTEGRAAARSRMSGRLGAMPTPVDIEPPGESGGEVGGRPRRLAHWCVWLPLVLWLTAVGVLWQRGLPAFDHGFEVLRPSESPAMEAFERLLGIDGGPDSERPLTVPVVITGDSFEDVSVLMRMATEEAARLQGDGLVGSFMFPQALWPDRERMEQRLLEAGNWWQGLPDLQQIADDVGFEPEALGLAEVTLGKWRQWAGSGDLDRALADVGSSALMARLIDLSPDSPAVLGTLEVPAGGNLAEIGARMRAVGHGIWPAAWESIAPAVEPLVWRDLLWVFTPMIAVLVGLLSLVFRGWRDVVLTLGGMTFAMTLLLAVMALAGWRWNFLVITAVPLLVGAGLDYSIHLLLAVKRHRGDLERVWLGVGRALVFCGLSTAIGFGSLTLAANRGLTGLGMVCSTGLLLMMATAVTLLPRWAVWFRRTERGG